MHGFIEFLSFIFKKTRQILIFFTQKNKAEFLDVEEDELFHVYKPTLSELGQTELLTKESKYDERKIK